MLSRYPDVCLLGDSQSRQVDNKFEQSPIDIQFRNRNNFNVNVYIVTMTKVKIIQIINAAETSMNGWMDGCLNYFFHDAIGNIFW